jgi:hypothetical protein
MFLFRRPFVRYCLTLSLGAAIKLTLQVNRTLKGQCHEIFDHRFFRQSITPMPQINTLKYFRKLVPRYAAKRWIMILRNASIARDHTYSFISRRIRNKIQKYFTA